MAVQNLVITAGADDGYGFATTAFLDTETTAFYGDDGDKSRTFLRFDLTADLLNATIDSAFLIGYMSGSAAVLVDVYGCDSDDPALPTDWTSLAALPNTTASVLWTTLNQGAGDQTSPDLKTIIQELVDSYGPLNGEGIMLLMIPDGQTNTTVKEISTFEDTQTGPRLNITYTTGNSTSGIINGGGGLTATTVSYDSQILRPASTITAGGWDTGPTTGQALHTYAGDDSDATWIEDTTS